MRTRHTTKSDRAFVVLFNTFQCGGNNAIAETRRSDAIGEEDTGAHRLTEESSTELSVLTDGVINSKAVSSAQIPILSADYGSISSSPIASTL